MKIDSITQFVKFCIVGFINTAVDWAAYFLLTAYIFTDHSSKPLAKAIAFLTAVTNSFVWNTLWTFRKEYGERVSEHKAGTKRTILAKFILVSLVGWGINYVVFRLSLESLSDNYVQIMSKSLNLRDVISLVFASATTILWNFFGNKMWTYRKSD